MPINLSMTFNYCTQFIQNTQWTLIINIIRWTRIQQSTLITISDHLAVVPALPLLRPGLSDLAV